MKKIIISFLLIFLVACSTQQTIVVKDRNDYCFVFPNDNSKCNCIEYEKKKEINYSILEKSCVPININQENDTIMKLKIVAEEQLVDIEEMREQFEKQTEGMDVKHILESELKFNVQRPMRNINFSFFENSLMCFDFGGEYKSVQIDNQVIQHSANLTNLYYYVKTNNCIKAEVK